MVHPRGTPAAPTHGPRATFHSLLVCRGPRTDTSKTLPAFLLPRGWRVGSPSAWRERLLDFQVHRRQILEQTSAMLGTGRVGRAHGRVSICMFAVTFLVFLHVGVWALVESLVRARYSIWWAAHQGCWSTHISVRGGWGWARARGQAEPGSWIFVLLDACSRLSPMASFLGGGLVSKPRPQPQRPLNTGSGQAGWARGS